MLDQPTVERLAQRLDEAERSKSLIPAFTREYPDLTIEDAYAIQRAWTKLQLSRGRIVRGHKIGLTSKAMQNAVGISEPDYGVLFADMFYPDASAIPFDRFRAPRIEVELAFVLKTPLEGPDCTLFDVLNATDYVTPALEILETRMHRVDPETKVPRKVMDTISDNAANAALVVGGTSGADQIVFSPAADGSAKINVVLNGVSLGNFATANLGHIIAYGLEGNDILQVTSRKFGWALILTPATMLST